MVKDMFVDEVVDFVYVYFFDFWWKFCYWKRCVMMVDFVLEIECVLIFGGWLYFWIDVWDYFDEMFKLVVIYIKLIGLIDVFEWMVEYDFDYCIYFERRMWKYDKFIYWVEFICK